jgi:hypothetical protein
VGRVLVAQTGGAYSGHCHARGASVSASDREQYLYDLSMGVAGTAIASGLVYFLGWLVGWVVTGFRQH